MVGSALILPPLGGSLVTICISATDINVWFVVDCDEDEEIARSKRYY